MLCIILHKITSNSTIYYKLFFLKNYDKELSHMRDDSRIQKIYIVESDYYNKIR